MPFDSIFDPSAWQALGIALLLTHITIISVTIYLHRHQAHHAIDLRAPASHFFRFWLWLTTGTVTREWVAVHRKHHACCESEQDPHSPRHKGLMRVLFGGLWLYRREARNADTLRKFGHGTPDDWLERQLYSGRPWAGIALMLAADLWLFGLPGLAIFALQMIWIPFWAAGVINGLGHCLGYRGFETSDDSTNILPWGLLVGGEELHNNHHAYMASARLSSRWYEIDLGWIYIRLLAASRLARIRRLAPRAASTRERRHIDRETVRAVVAQRFYILWRYGRLVVRPALREARRGTDRMGRRMIQRARKLLTRELVSVDPGTEQTFELVLQQHKTLETIYRFKQQLKQVWVRGPDGHRGRVERLRAWCAASEQSGIAALEEFAGFLRGYRLQPL